MDKQEIDKVFIDQVLLHTNGIMYCDGGDIPSKKEAYRYIGNMESLVTFRNALIEGMGNTVKDAKDVREYEEI